MTHLRAFRAATTLACVLVVFFADSPAWSAYPEKTVRLIGPSPPGGGNDIMARMAGQKLAEAWGRQVAVDNRPGAGGAIAFDMAARAESNGFTLLLGSTNLTVLPDMRKVNYDPIKDFVPVSLMAKSMNILLDHPSVPAKSAKELIALAKKNPGKLNYATSIATSVHLAAELFKAKAGVNIVIVSYKGWARHWWTSFQARWISHSPTRPRRGITLRANRPVAGAAVTGERRSVMLPDVPTIAESVIPGFEASTWLGILAPSGTPTAIVSEVNGKLAAALAQRDVMDRIAALGADLVGGTPQQLAEHLNAEILKWREVIRAANIRL